MIRLHEVWLLTLLRGTASDEYTSAKDLGGGDGKAQGCEATLAAIDMDIYALPQVKFLSLGLSLNILRTTSNCVLDHIAPP